ncbi:MAG: hypothetical protein CMJ35_12230 [Phycisphaerae bacterium]|nr:hypothetical protein [Phycisphaerae bacterium]MBM92363.1 hypothetical protein [Phycisphaerae bacterium]HCT45146.1 hypothetical protein [Phycisphaerales bacterium]|tara:strand:+ start:220 stop:828 length:609 start_codon:yes stop_codon:yes gene_type:complete
MTDQSVISTVNEHAERMWQAEQRVAERYAERTKLLTTQIVAVLAATTVSFSTLIINTRNDDRTLPIIIMLSLLTGLYTASTIFMILALSRLLHSSQYPMRAAAEFLEGIRANTENSGPKHPPTASWELALPADYLTWLADEVDPAIQTVILQVLHAVEDLQTRNLKERYRIRAGESAMNKGFWCALGFLFAFAGMYAIILWF